jgi:hypothetical protein
MVSNSQQYLDQEIELKIIGNLAQFSGDILNVTPDTIQGSYDFVPVDGTLPLDRFAQANLWKEILLGTTKIPQIAMEYSIGKIFAWIAQLSGLRNIDQFRIVPGTPEHLQAQLQAGNLVGMQSGSGGSKNSNNIKQPTGNVGPIPVGGDGNGFANAA